MALLAVFLMRQQDRQLKVSLTSVNVECGWGLDSFKFTVFAVCGDGLSLV
ncbi:MAG: hypothetical protein ACLRXQ_08500 [Phascolarctobacterium faecium]